MNDTFLSKNTGGLMRNPISFVSSLSGTKKQINNLGSPQFDSSAANKRYVDSEINKIKLNQASDSTFVKKTGDTMTSDLIIHNSYS